MAVFTKVARGDLETFLKNYDLGTVRSFDGIAEGVENTNYKLVTDKGRYILTLYEKRVEEKDLPFFLSLMDHLAQNGVPTARPITRKDGAQLGTLCSRPAALIEFLNGKAVETPNAAQAFFAGRALAEMHRATATFKGSRTNALGPEGWQTLLAKCASRADEVQNGLTAELTSVLDDVSSLWPKSLPRGVIHADLFPDNVLFNGDEVGGLIDFYFACTDFYAYDLAVTLNSWAFPGNAFDGAIAAALTEGYQTLRPLSDTERAALPLLCRGAALRFILTRLWDLLNHNESWLVTPKDPLALLPNLRFHRTAEPSAYGV